MLFYSSKSPTTHYMVKACPVFNPINRSIKLKEQENTHIHTVMGGILYA
uniref:Uncharacterized protein n=1 Tax=Arundo donax TaxID=35708 RepID=A0A0A9EPL1_ARUDO